LAKGRERKSIAYSKIKSLKIIENQMEQSKKEDQKGKAIASLILGIVSILPLVGRIFIIYWIKTIPAGELLVYLLTRTPLIAFLGLILGILGLKSTKKKFAIAGIILCLIGLIVPLYYFLR
jgi:hypothetical protein